MIRLDTRAQCVFPSCLFRVISTKYGALTWPDGRMTPWTINNETRIIEAHKPIAKLSSRCRTRVEIAHRVSLVPRATNRARFCVNVGKRLADDRLKELLISDFTQSNRIVVFFFVIFFFKLSRHREVIIYILILANVFKHLQITNLNFLSGC